MANNCKRDNLEVRRNRTRRPEMRLGEVRWPRPQGHHLIESVKPVGWDQWRFAAPAHPDF